MLTCLSRLSLLARSVALLICVAAIASAAHAQGGCVNGGSGGCTATVPEIAPGIATQAAALLTGAGLWLRSRRRR